MSILTWSKWFIRLSIPTHLVDDISGDLEEEYTTIILPANNRFKAKFWLIQQTIFICAHFIFSLKNIGACLISVVAISLSFLMIVSVFWLSDLSDSDAKMFSDFFWKKWLHGNSYQLFFEPAFWQSAPKVFLQPIDWSIWFYKPALIYAFILFFILHKINISKNLSVLEYFLMSTTGILLPYLAGNILFFFMNIKMTESGPIVAFMWLSTLYLMIPISYQLVRRLKKVDNSFT